MKPQSSSASKRKVPAARRARAADDAILALLIAAMDANGHVSPEEAARAHHLIWSMRRFRRKSGETVGRGIDDMRSLVEQRGAAKVLEEGTRRIPRHLREAVFAVAADLLLADGTLEPSERRFLERLAGDLRIDVNQARRIRDVIMIKNAL